MDTGPLSPVGEGPLEGETVCAALARYEATLKAAVHELHADVGAFKVGVERRLEEAERLHGPLGRAVAQLQLENRQLRAQLEMLTRRLEALTGTACDRSALLDGTGTTGPEVPDSPSNRSPTSPTSAVTTSNQGVVLPAAAASRFSSRATFAVFSKTSSIEKEEPIEVDPSPACSIVENGHPAMPEKTVTSQELKSTNSDSLHDHTAPTTRSRPHLPITAVTKTTEISSTAATKSPESLTSPVRAQPTFSSEHQASSQSVSTSSLRQTVVESPQSGPGVKVWSAGAVKTMGSPRISDRTSALTASRTVTYSPAALSNAERVAEDSVETSFGQGVEKKRELVRSQTLPRSIGAQARRSMFERLDSDPSRSKPVDSKPKLKRSQSFGVSSASSIKQILLEWCRSKTIGYPNIDIQNFSSSWSDGLAFCALVHSFFPAEFDYNALTAADRKRNFEIAFGTAEAKAGCDRLIEVEDMMVMGHKPDPMCVFTYVQSLYNHLRRFE